MSRIDNLIQRLCPDGVRHYELREVSEYSSTRIDAAKLDGTSFVGVDNLMPDKGGRTDANYSPNTSRLTAYSAGDLLIGNIRPYLKKIWLADRDGGCSGDVLAVHVREQCQDKLSPRFLYYLLSSDRFFAYDMQHAKGAKMPRGDKDAVMKFCVPVPPFPVQEEIVRILDSFTSLEAELEAELEARKKQYEYYRDYLFSGYLSSRSDVKNMSLGNLGEFVRGQGLQKKDFESSGFGCIHYGQIYTTYGVAVKRTVSFINPILFGKLRHAHHGDLVIATTSENDEDVCKAVAWLGSQDIAVGGDAYIYRHHLDPLYTAFLFSSSTFQEQKRRYITGTKVRRVTGEFMAKIVVPVPSLDVQRNIADKLDRFDSLVNDLSSGLPAEIEARRKQYEYYRDRLLTFRERGSA